MPVDRPVIAQPEFFENDAGDDQPFYAFFDLVSEMRGRLAGHGFNEAARLVVKMGKGRTGGDAV